MEPKSPLPRFENEIPAVPHEATGEAVPSPHEYEPTVERGHERVEQRADASLATAQQVAALPIPVPPVMPQAQTSDDGVSGGVPAAAGDEDLIEKEWVDKAKQIIEQTKDDPYRREQEVSKLQAEYLRKRYGREMGAPQ